MSEWNKFKISVKKKEAYKWLKLFKTFKIGLHSLHLLWSGDFMYV